MIPIPFSRVTISYGEPILVPPDTKGEEFVAAKKDIGELLIYFKGLLHQKEVQLIFKYLHYEFVEIGN